MDNPIIYRLTFNCYLQQFFDSSQYKDQIEKRLQDFRYRIIHDREVYIPIGAEAAAVKRREGYLLIDHNDQKCLCVRQIVIDFMDTELSIEYIDDLTGHQMASAMIYQNHTFNRESQ